MKVRIKSSKKVTVLLTFVIVNCSFWLSSLAASQAFIPADDDYVVETLSGPVIRLSQHIRSGEALQSPRASSSSSSVDTDLLTVQIVDAYRLAATSQDPRAYGRVLALLDQWPEQLVVPALLHVINASVLQHNHKFSDALAEVGHALESESLNRQLNIQSQTIRAQIGLVTADYELTRASCEALMSLASEAVYINCAAQLDGVTGKAEQALAAVNSVLGSVQRITQQERIELMITAATIAHRLGDYTSAQSYYRQVLVASPQNFYTLVNYANLLLEQNRAIELVNLLQLYPDEDRGAELNILLAEALMLSYDVESAKQISSTLEREFELAFLRNEAIPFKDLARYSLRLKPDPSQALEAALANWSSQKEPSDALLLARAAVLSDEKSVLKDLQLWVEKNGTQSKQLENIFSEHGV